MCQVCTFRLSGITMSRLVWASAEKARIRVTSMASYGRGCATVARARPAGVRAAFRARWSGPGLRLGLDAGLDVHADDRLVLPMDPRPGFLDGQASGRRQHALALD